MHTRISISAGRIAACAAAVATLGLLAAPAASATPIELPIQQALSSGSTSWVDLCIDLGSSTVCI